MWTQIAYIRFPPCGVADNEQRRGRRHNKPKQKKRSWFLQMTCVEPAGHEMGAKGRKRMKPKPEKKIHRKDRHGTMRFNSSVHFCFLLNSTHITAAYYVLGPSQRTLRNNIRIRIQLSCHLVEIWKKQRKASQNGGFRGEARVRTQDLRVHHHFPCIHGQLRIVKAPVERFVCDGLVGRIVVWCDVRVFECLWCRDALSGVKHQHFLQ